MSGSRWLLRAMGRREPLTSGRVHVPGLDGEVLIRRDLHGVPHIDATTSADAGFALGFCLGQDRTFQLEMILRLVRGTTAELLGEALVPVDRLARRIDFRAAAGVQLAASRPETRSWIEGHVHGINAGARSGRGRRPHELAMLRRDVTPWETEDLVGALAMTAFLLPANWDVEFARLQMLLIDGPDAVRDLDIGYPAGGPVTADPGGAGAALIDRLGADLADFAEVARSSGGSNAWAVAGSRTATGRPLLANDPHLPPTIPPHLYLAHVRTPTWETTGAFWVGRGLCMTGQNAHAAWGLTAGYVDNTDLVMEELDGDRVRTADGWLPCERRSERIEVRGGDPVVEEVLGTPNGPIISPALVEAPVALSLRATWRAAHPLDVLLVHREPDLEGFRELAAGWSGISANIVWAERSGRIAWQLIGRPPVRRGGAGTVPARGCDRDDGWDGLLPFDRMPWAESPSAGFLVSANNPPTPTAPEAVGRDWLDVYRARRLEEVVSGRSDWTVAAAAFAQLDVRSGLWDDLAEVALAAPVSDPDGRQAVALLATWDGAVTGDSAAASVFELFVAGLYRQVVQARAPGSASWALGRGPSPFTPRNLFWKRRGSLLVRLLRERPDGWFDRPWDEVVAEALSAAVRDLRHLADDPAAWRWGRIRPLVLVHPLGRRAPFGRLFNLGPFPAGGDHDTPSQHGVDLTDPTQPASVHPALRAVLDPGDPEASRFALPGGQSGNPLSRHYDDQLGAYSSGRGIGVAWTAAAIAATTRRTLRLSPGEEPERLWSTRRARWQHWRSGAA
ncbi:MAG: penicillin acylase family protein [Nitriliruptoraceae bacterium]